MFTFLFIILVVAVSTSLTFHGLTIDQLISWFNHHPFLAIFLIQIMFFGKVVINNNTKKNKEIV